MAKVVTCGVQTNDGDLVMKLTKNHSLSKLTICGLVATDKGFGAQVEYGIYDT